MFIKGNGLEYLDDGAQAHTPILRCRHFQLLRYSSIGQSASTFFLLARRPVVRRVKIIAESVMLSTKYNPSCISTGPPIIEGGYIIPATSWMFLAGCDWLRWWYFYNLSCTHRRNYWLKFNPEYNPGGNHERSFDSLQN